MSEDVVKLTIEGKPQGKQRPRSYRRGNFIGHYTPKETASRENLIRLAFVAEVSGKDWDKGGYFAVDVGIGYKIPASFSRAKKDMALLNVIAPDKKPDVDNVLKLVMDGLSGAAWHDDKQVVSANCRKFYCSDGNATAIVVRRLGEDDLPF